MSEWEHRPSQRSKESSDLDIRSDEEESIKVPEQNQPTEFDLIETDVHSHSPVEGDALLEQLRSLLEDILKGKHGLQAA